MKWIYILGWIDKCIEFIINRSAIDCHWEMCDNFDSICWLFTRINHHYSTSVRTVADHCRYVHCEICCLWPDNNSQMVIICGWVLCFVSLTANQFGYIMGNFCKIAGCVAAVADGHDLFTTLRDGISRSHAFPSICADNLVSISKEVTT